MMATTTSSSTKLNPPLDIRRTVMRIWFPNMLCFIINLVFLMMQKTCQDQRILKMAHKYVEKETYLQFRFGDDSLGMVNKIVVIRRCDPTSNVFHFL